MFENDPFHKQTTHPHAFRELKKNKKTKKN